MADNVVTRGLKRLNLPGTKLAGQIAYGIMPPRSRQTTTARPAEPPSRRHGYYSDTNVAARDWLGDRGLMPGTLPQAVPTNRTVRDTLGNEPYLPMMTRAEKPMNPASPVASMLDVQRQPTAINPAMSSASPEPAGPLTQSLMPRSSVETGPATQMGSARLPRSATPGMPSAPSQVPLGGVQQEINRQRLAATYPEAPILTGNLSGLGGYTAMTPEPNAQDPELAEAMTGIRQRNEGDLYSNRPYGQRDTFAVGGQHSGGMTLNVGGPDVASRLSPPPSPPERERNMGLANMSLRGSERVQGSILDRLSPEDRGAVLERGRLRTQADIAGNRMAMSDEQLDRIAASQQARDARTQAVRDRGIERGKQREERMEIRRAAQTPGGLATRLMQGGEQGGVDPLLRMAAFQGNPIAMKALGEMSVAGVGAKTQLGVAQIDADVRREGIKQSREMSDADLEFKREELTKKLEDAGLERTERTKLQKELQVTEHAQQLKVQEADITGRRDLMRDQDTAALARLERQETGLSDRLDKQITSAEQLAKMTQEGETARTGMLTGTQKEIATLTDAGETERAKMLATSRLDELNTEIAARKERGEATDQLEREKAGLAAITQRLISAEGAAVERERIAADAPVREGTAEKLGEEAKWLRQQREEAEGMSPDKRAIATSILDDKTTTPADKLRQLEALRDETATTSETAQRLAGMRPESQRTGSGWMNHLNEDVASLMASSPPGDSTPEEARRKLAELKKRGWTEEKIQEYANKWAPWYMSWGLDVGAARSVGKQLGMTRNAFVQSWLDRGR